VEGQLSSGTSVKISDHPVNLAISPKYLVHAKKSSYPVEVEIPRKCNINCRLVLSV